MEPFDVQETLTVQQVKEVAFAQWPTGACWRSLGAARAAPARGFLNAPHALIHAEGPLSKENPSSAADLRILCAGKFLENGKTLKGAPPPRPAPHL